MPRSHDNCFIPGRVGAALFAVVSFIFSFVNLFDGRVTGFFVFLGLAVLLGLIAFLLTFAHAAFREKVSRDSNA